MRTRRTLRFLDANVILRFLTKDHPEHSEAVRPLFRELEEGTVAVTTSESVLVEVVQVLSSKALYNLPREEVRRHVIRVLNLRGLKIPGKRFYRRALEIYVQVNVDFVDALVVAQMERDGISTVISFDKDFDRFPLLSREEPGRDAGAS